MLREQTNLCNWRWVGTNCNPADVLSRDLGVKRLLEHDLWWKGPLFLTSGNPWPALKIKPSPHIELEGERELLRLVGIYTSRDSAHCPFELHSKFLTNCRIMRSVLRFAHNLGRCRQFQADLQGAREALMRWEQVKHWSYEMGLLENGGELPLRHEWQRFVCGPGNGLVRVQTRAAEGRLVLLPDKSFLTRQWLVHLHENVLHHVGGHRALLACSRRIAWVCHGISECKNIVWSCATCRRREPTPITQRMGPLPDFRMSPKDGIPVAFATVGLDVAGPFFTKQGRGKARHKRYLLLFCCTVFRAVHLEMLYGLETSDILLALQRFASRRGLPLRLVSDNAAYFKRAALEVGEGHHFRGVSESSSRVSWVFNPANAPHTGGVFERLIGSAKRALQAVLGGADFWDDELASAFVFVEGILNDRPLDFLSTDVSDLEPLTPGHFLAGPRVQENAFSDLDNGSSFSRRWRHINTTVEKYWQRFVEEVKPGLGLRPKWHGRAVNLKGGDVVVILGEKGLNGRWPLGRVVGVHPGKDGLVRVVTVKVQGREYKRHMNCMMPLFRE